MRRVEYITLSRTSLSSFKLVLTCNLRNLPRLGSEKSFEQIPIVLCQEKPLFNNQKGTKFFKFLISKLIKRHCKNS